MVWVIVLSVLLGIFIYKFSEKDDSFYGLVVALLFVIVWFALLAYLAL